VRTRVCAFQRWAHTVLLGFDTRPFKRESIGVHAQIGENADVLRLAVVVVASISRRLDEVRTCGHSRGQRSALTLPPSTWWPAVAAPHRKPSGKRDAPMEAAAVIDSPMRLKSRLSMGASSPRAKGCCGTPLHYASSLGLRRPLTYSDSRSHRLPLLLG
jgi:hypothetical protein